MRWKGNRLNSKWFIAYAEALTAGREVCLLTPEFPVQLELGL